jgi:hypothetical protein
MYSLLKTKLRARNLKLGFDREYVMGLGKSLFQQWYVTVTFSRFNAGGTNRTALFSGQEDALNFIHQRLRRRLSSPICIGCP